MRPCKEEFRRYASQLGMVADADPTSSGKYSRWILRQLVANDLRFPDDVEKVFNLLADLHRIKRRLPVERRDITHFDSYSELYDFVTASMPQAQSKMERVQVGANLLYADDTWELIELTTVEAVVKASQNTGWCTCNTETAAAYLRGPLYLVLKGGEKFMLMSEDNKEFMLVNNTPYQGGDSTLLRILKEHIPESICGEHDDLVTHIECSKCEEVGCEGMVECEFCNGDYVCEDCASLCSSCEKVACDNCSKECGECSNLVCEKCQQICSICEDTDQPLCLDHATKCTSCEEDVICSSCATICIGCEEALCEDCGMNCTVCDGKGEVSAFCDSCRVDDMIKCPSCGEKVCAPHLETMCSPVCACDTAVCADCASECNECDTTVCDDCGSSCADCGNATCKDCRFGCRCGQYFCSSCVGFECGICEIRLCDGCSGQSLHSCSFK